MTRCATAPAGPRPAFHVEHRTDDGAVLVGPVVYARTAVAALDRAEASADARPGTWERLAGDAVLAWLA
ncbi:hypothetical protein [Pseudokineococcus lusitanus]|uniref:Uncharacterized protein n=1 Tax=Pseudokineococcus lusitanus TaxID=763993 RepID=A0A3N1HTS6_9ACTN|nr:hypothetical protein [Pseudokineococcus lusitanus]ROP45925.1 hypothetical protein EDC03_0540 [Pseudokineococcus lusitanus]